MKINHDTIKTEVFTRLPDKYRDQSGRIPKSAPRYGIHVDSFLEGPAFDRDGNLYVVDIPFGRIFRIDANGDWDIAAKYDGEPNGLAIHTDGTIYIADFKHGLMVLDPKSGSVSPFLEYRHTERFRGLNDLFFAPSGDLYFTDQGLTSLSDPTGRVYRLSAEQKLDCLLYNGPSPNGIVLHPKGDMLYVAMTASSSVWRMQPVTDGSTRPRNHSQMMCGAADGLAMDEEANLIIANAGVGIVWIVDKRGMPTHRIETCAGDMTTNIAYGGADRRTLYITESETGQILKAPMPVAGAQLFSHTEQ